MFFDDDGTAYGDWQNAMTDLTAVEAERDALREQTLRLGDANKRLWAALTAIRDEAHRAQEYPFGYTVLSEIESLAEAALRGEGGEDGS